MENIIKSVVSICFFFFIFYISFLFFQLGPDTDRHRDHLCADRLRPVLLLLPRSVLCEGRGPETADEEIRHIEEARVFTSVCVCLNNVLNYLMFVYIIYRTYCEIVLILVNHWRLMMCIFNGVYIQKCSQRQYAQYDNISRQRTRSKMSFNSRNCINLSIYMCILFFNFRF